MTEPVMCKQLPLVPMLHWWALQVQLSGTALHSVVPTVVLSLELWGPKLEPPEQTGQESLVMEPMLQLSEQRMVPLSAVSEPAL